MYWYRLQIKWDYKKQFKKTYKYTMNENTIGKTLVLGSTATHTYCVSDTASVLKYSRFLVM
jgi:hypothetical protein